MELMKEKQDKVREHLYDVAINHFKKAQLAQLNEIETLQQFGERVRTIENANQRAQHL